MPIGIMSFFFILLSSNFSSLNESNITGRQKADK